MSKLDSLEVDFRPLVEELIRRTEEITKRKWGISDARRTMKQQADIYEQGRTKPGKVVSNAKPGQSAHNFGYAVDLWPLTKNQKNFDWSANRVLFDQMGKIAVSLGLTWGGNFKSILDLPHVEHLKWKPQQAKWRAGEIQIA